MKSNGIIWIIPVVFILLSGCSATKEAEKPDESQTQPSGFAIPNHVKEANRERALKHFIDGALHDSKGDYAKAILEYQDALRYDQDPAIYFALSKDYSLLGKHALAAQSGQEAILLDSTNVSYRENLAAIYLNAGQRDRAVSEYEGVLTLDSNNTGAWYALARLHQAKRPLKAIEIFERLLDREGESAEILLQVAQLYAVLGRFDKGAEYYERLLALEPGNRIFQLQLAEIYQRAGKPEQAISILEKMLEVDEGDVEAIATLADLHLQRGEFQRASALFERLLEIEEDNPEVKLRVGAAYIGQVESDSTLLPKAKKLLEEAARDMPQNWRPFWYLGIVADMRGEDSAATAFFEQVTRLGGETFEAWWIVGTRAFEAAQHDKVIDLMERAKKLFPTDFRSYLLLGLSYSQQGKNQDAAANLRKSLELNPNDVNALGSLALVLDGMKRFEESDSLYERALELEPNSSINLNNYSYSLAERGLQLERALAMALEAVKDDSLNSSYLDTLGWIYYKLDRFDEAALYIEKAIEAGDASAVVHEHLGDIYYKLGRSDEAAEYWRKALDIDSTNAELKAKIERGSL